MFGQADRLRCSRSLLLQRIASSAVWLTEVLYRFNETRCSRGAKAYTLESVFVALCKNFKNLKTGNFKNLKISRLEKVAVGQGKVGQ